MRANIHPVVERSRARGSALTMSVIVALVAMAPALHAQAAASGVADGVESRWAPWLGCWELVRNTVQEADHLRPGAPPPGRPGPATAGETRLCVEPGEAGAVRLRTEVQGRTVLEETVVADGSRRPLDEERGCTGWRRTEWSRDGRRMFGRAELACAGEPPQALSQLWLLSGDAWFEFQGATIDGRQGVRVRRYRRVDGAGAETVTRRAPAGALDLDAVEEASGKVDPLVLQAALVETGSRFRLDGRALLALQDAGVPGDVTDLMVALSYPQHFRVRRPRASGGSVGPIGPAGWLSDPSGWYYDPFWSYMPFAYSYWGAGGGWWWGHPGTSIGAPDGGGGGGVPREGRGRVINNQGYTRIERREADRARTRGASSGSTASTGSTDSSGSSGSGSSSSGATSSGYSSGGSSDGGGRTAVPR